MPERVYRDLTPGLCDVPDSTWAAATVENVGELLTQRSDLEDPAAASLLELLQSQYIPPMTDEDRKLLSELSPDAVAIYDEQIYMDWVARRRRGRRTMPHHRQFEDRLLSD